MEPSLLLGLLFSLEMCESLTIESSLYEATSSGGKSGVIVTAKPDQQIQFHVLECQQGKSCHFSIQQLQVEQEKVRILTNTQYSNFRALRGPEILDPAENLLFTRD